MIVFLIGCCHCCAVYMWRFEGRCHFVVLEAVEGHFVGWQQTVCFQNAEPIVVVVIVELRMGPLSESGADDVLYGHTLWEELQ